MTRQAKSAAASCEDEDEDGGELDALLSIFGLVPAPPPSKLNHPCLRPNDEGRVRKQGGSE